MQAVAIQGPGATELADRLVDRLDGRVGVVRRAARDGGAATGRAGSDGTGAGDTAYTLGADAWRGNGDDLSLPGALDRLAPDHAVALVVGFPETRLPTVAVGQVSLDGEPLVRVDSADSLDPVVDAIDGVEPHETLESLVARVKHSPQADRAGAIATFTGRVRAKDSPDDERTEYLEFEKYEGVADERMRTIESELADRDGVLSVVLHHRTGVVEAGEDIVFVVVLAGHREEAFRTVEDGINRLKAEVPLFKKEVTESETFWVHERD